MAHGFLTPTDIRQERNYLGAIAGAIGSRVMKASDMARAERKNAVTQLGKETNSQGKKGTLSDIGMEGRGSFFKRALGSTFGGDRIARTRGRFESDPPGGRDPTKTQAGRFRAGFDYKLSGPTAIVGGGSPDVQGVNVQDLGSPGGSGGGGAGFLGIGGFAKAASGVAGYLSSGNAITPEVLDPLPNQGLRSRPSPSLQSAAIDVQGEEIKDVVRALNGISQLIVQSSSNTSQSIDQSTSVIQQGFLNLGQLQTQIATRQLQQQRSIATEAMQFQEQMLERQRVLADKSGFTPEDKSDNLRAIKSSFKSPLDAIGGVIQSGMNMLGNFMGGGGMPGMGMGGGIGRSIGQLTRGGALKGGQGRMVGAMGGRALAMGATKMFGRGGIMKVLRPVFKRIPIFGGLLDFAVSLAMGEPIGRAAAKAVGGMLGAGLGSLVPIPGVGTILGGVLGDMVGGAIYDAIAGGNKEGDGGGLSVPELAAGARIKGSESGVLVRVGEGGPGKDERVIATDKASIEREEKTKLNYQLMNKHKYAKLGAESHKLYFEQENGWKNLGGFLGDFIKNFRLPGISLPSPGPGGDDWLQQLQHGLGLGSRNTTNATGPVSSRPTGKEVGINMLQGSSGSPIALSRTSTVANTRGGLHHGRENFRQGEGGSMRVRDYLIGNRSGAEDGSDALGANIYTPLGIGNLKFVKTGQFGIKFYDESGKIVGYYEHVENRQDQYDGKMIPPGTFVGTQGGLPGTPSALGTSSSVHLHVEGTDAFHNALIATYADGNIFNQPAHNNPPSANEEAAAAPPTRNTPANVDKTALEKLFKKRTSLRSEVDAMNKPVNQTALKKLENAMHKGTKAERDAAAIKVPGVGTIQAWNNGFVKKLTYWDENGNEFKEKDGISAQTQFMKHLAEKSRLKEDEIKSLDEQMKEMLRGTGPQASLSGVQRTSTGTDVLTPSATVALNREQRGGIVAVPALAQGGGGGGDNGALLAASIGPTKAPGSNPAELFRTAAMIAV